MASSQSSQSDSSKSVSLPPEQALSQLLQQRLSRIPGLDAPSAVAFTEFIQVPKGGCAQKETFLRWKKQSTGGDSSDSGDS